MLCEYNIIYLREIASIGVMLHEIKSVYGIFFGTPCSILVRGNRQNVLSRFAIEYTSLFGAVYVI